MSHDQSSVWGGVHSNSESVSKFKSLFKKPPSKITKSKKSIISKKKKPNVCESNLRDIRKLLPSRGVKPELDEVRDSDDSV